MPIYMKVPGVAGEVSAAGHKGWIELQSCQLGTHSSVTGAGGAGREASVSSINEIVATKSQDASTTALFRLSLWGEGKKFEIDFIKLEDKLPCTYLSIELENTLISSYSVSGHGGSAHGRPMESLSLNFTKMTLSSKACAASIDPQSLKDKALWDMAASTRVA